MTRATNIWIAVRSVLQSRPESLERVLTFSQAEESMIVLDYTATGIASLIYEAKTVTP